MIETDDLQQFTQNYMPTFPGASEGNDPRVTILSLLNEGRSERVIELYDPDQEGTPDDPRVLNGLTWAYLMEGMENRAKELSDAAIAHFHRTGEATHEATALVHRGAVAWRQQGSQAAETWLRRAIQVEPGCCIAWMNLINYASKDRDSTAVERMLQEFTTAVPEWSGIPEYRHWLAHCNDLSFARSLKCFAPMTNRLSS